MKSAPKAALVEILAAGFGITATVRNKSEIEKPCFGPAYRSDAVLGVHVAVRLDVTARLAVREALCVSIFQDDHVFPETVCRTFGARIYRNTVLERRHADASSRLEHYCGRVQTERKPVRRRIGGVGQHLAQTSHPGRRQMDISKASVRHALTLRGDWISTLRD